jgi:hypothetical protein
MFAEQKVRKMRHKMAANAVDGVNALSDYDIHKL